MRKCKQMKESDIVPRKKVTLTNYIPISVHRLESALFSVRRDNFYCCNDFDLSTKVTVQFKDDGYFTVEPQDWMTRSPDTRIAPYLIRTSFCAVIFDERMDGCLRKQALEWAESNNAAVQALSRKNRVEAL